MHKRIQIACNKCFYVVFKTTEGLIIFIFFYRGLITLGFLILAHKFKSTEYENRQINPSSH